MFSSARGHACPVIVLVSQLGKKEAFVCGGEKLYRAIGKILIVLGPQK